MTTAAAPLDDTTDLLLLHEAGRGIELRALLAQWTGTAGHDDVALTRLYAMLLLQWGRQDDAVQMLQAAATRLDADALLHNDLGAMLFERRALLSAAQAFDRALALDPSLDSARDNAHSTQNLLASVDEFLRQAREARAQWNLGAAVQLAEQALGLTTDCEAAEVLRNGARIELGDYALAAQMPSTAHDARDFAVVAEEILSGNLTAQNFPRHRRHLAGFSVSAHPAAPPAQMPERLRLGLEALADENYAAGIRRLSAWCDASDDGPEVHLTVDQRQQFVLSPARARPTPAPRVALLLELALRLADRRLAQGAAAAYLRVLRTQGRGQDALRIEQFLAQENPDSKTFLEATRFIDLPTETECGPRAQRQTFVIIGTCIAEGIRYVLNLSPAFRARFRLRHFITNRAARSMAEFVIPDELLHGSAVVAHVAPQWADWGNEQAYIDLLARIPAHVQRISFAYPSFQPLWPFHCRDVRQGQALPEGMWRPHEERPYYPYGDSYLHGLMRTATDAEDVVRRYLKTDLSREIDLDKLLQNTLRIHRDREACTDIKVVDDIEAHFRHQRLFDSVNHITNVMALRIANQILARLEIAPLPESLLARSGEILSPQMPIHPSVARHFGLRYIDDETRYAVDHHRRLTYAEFIADYVKFV